MQKMDPQLRKLLEVSYEALIHSGLIIGDLPSERCGVYIGCCGSEVKHNSELFSEAFCL